MFEWWAEFKHNRVTYLYDVKAGTWPPDTYTMHLRVVRKDGKGGISWDVLQAIKNEAFGSDARAVEVYPEVCDLVNDVNMRHLWLVPERVPIPNLKGG